MFHKFNLFMRVAAPWKCAARPRWPRGGRRTRRRRQPQERLLELVGLGEVEDGAVEANEDRDLRKRRQAVKTTSKISKKS